MSMSAIQNVVGVRFSKVGKIYHFDATSLGEVKTGDSVVVETARGWQLGEVAQVVDLTVKKPEGDLKSVSRLATPRDLLLRKVWQVRELDVVEAARKRAEEINLRTVKIVSAEYSFDGSRLAIMYSTESEEKVDLKSLRSDMQKLYTPTQVEMRQIGPRDVAKIIGGMGACGLEKRCCSAFLTDFSSISIRMAKEQGISLSPTEITGMCGRLRCCLIYEYDTYTELRKGLPKRGKHITTPVGEGKVLDVSPLQGTVRVEIPEVGIREFTKAELS
ncbi:stage 0 sporulation protein, partial [bacterium]|nr:stage 0 sporulation protein [bacterium]